MTTTIKKTMSKGKWLLVLALCSMLAGCGSAGAEASGTEEKAMDLINERQDEVTEEEVGSDAILWKGVSYVYNEYLSNYLFLGVDRQELAETSVGQSDAGQSDALFLLSWNRKTGDMTVISIPRDTMTTYDYYARDGSRIGTVTDHISLAYAYGDGKHESCQFSKDAVSSLFYGLPIQGYCSVSLEGLSALMKGVGELKVTIPNDSLESKNPDWKEGTELILTEENLETYIRYRDISVSQTAIARLERQKSFLEAYAERAMEAFRENPSFVAKTYAAVDPYMVTNMSNDQFVKLMESAAAGGTVTQWTVPGTGVEGENYDEFYADDDVLYEKIMETFYIEEE